MRNVTRLLATSMFVATALCGVASAQNGPAVGDAPPAVDCSQWANGSAVMLGDYKQNQVLLLWFFCQ